MGARRRPSTGDLLELSGRCGPDASASAGGRPHSAAAGAGAEAGVAAAGFAHSAASRGAARAAARRRACRRQAGGVVASVELTFSRAHVLGPVADLIAEVAQLVADLGAPRP